MSTEDIKAFSLGKIFGSGKYLIPLYQRNYAWKAGQILQLIHDIYDFSNNKDQKYYIGTLVVFKREQNAELYETIDGQQRLTTLNILYSVLKNVYHLGTELADFKNVILDFENRILSSRALELVYEGRFDTAIKYNTSIENAYHIIEKELKIIFGEYKNTTDKFLNFVSYLNENVILLRVNVPAETDLNHYFEIMNNRGEQLEKHEVLKSVLLGYLDKIDGDAECEKSKLLFNTIWEGCSQMERYIQYGFSKNQRSKIFGNCWDRFIASSFDEVLQSVDFDEKTLDNLSNQLENEDRGFSIEDITNDQTYSTIVKEGTTETSERFNSVINFQNFILHCLLIQTKNEKATLDDKKLIKNFDFLKNLEDNEQIEFVKNFAFTILKTKYLLDHYIIKREFLNNKDSWSLKRLFYYSDKSQSYINTFGNSNEENSDEGSFDTKHLIWLLSMFHTVAPNMMYKQWLNASLNFLYDNYSLEGISSSNYIKFLRELADNFVFNRFLSSEPKGYYELIYNEPSELNISNLDWSKLRYESIENNLIFNYIDYLLICKELENRSDIEGYFSFISNFDFTFRSSVEHYYPQNPKDGHDKLDEKFLHSIGNLTLISHSKNSAMNNYQPKAKKEHYKNGSTADSVKQYLMFNKYPDLSWGINEIKEHEDEIISLIKEKI